MSRNVTENQTAPTSIRSAALPFLTEATGPAGDGNAARCRLMRQGAVTFWASRDSTP